MCRYADETVVSRRGLHPLHPSPKPRQVLNPALVQEAHSTATVHNFVPSRHRLHRSLQHCPDPGSRFRLYATAAELGYHHHLQTLHQQGRNLYCDRSAECVHRLGLVAPAGADGSGAPDAEGAEGGLDLHIWGRVFVNSGIQPCPWLDL
jgi:hypothetical protein